ncbi:MAG: sugar phosphate isomerase/epimerase family protein [Botrimarina sp.]
MNQLTTYRWSFEEDLVRYAESGYDGVGVWLRKLSDFGVERGVDLVADTGLSVAGMSWVGGFTGADAASPRENLAVARDALRVAAQLKAACLKVHSGGPNGHIRGHAMRLFRQALDQLLPFAEEFGVPLAIEPMHQACAAEWTLLTDLASALALVREYDSPGLKLAMDTYHFPIGPEGWPLLRELAPHLAVVHLGDIDRPHGVDQWRRPLGQGAAPLGGIVRTLCEAGYTGMLDVKLIGPEFTASDYETLLVESRAAVADLTTDAMIGPLRDEPGCATRPDNQPPAVDSPERDQLLLRP